MEDLWPTLFKETKRYQRTQNKTTLAIINWQEENLALKYQLGHL
jgi:hypothetical protein